jgi:hypothetical protein
MSTLLSSASRALPGPPTQQQTCVLCPAFSHSTTDNSLRCPCVAPTAGSPGVCTKQPSTPRIVIVDRNVPPQRCHWWKNSSPTKRPHAISHGIDILLPNPATYMRIPGCVGLTLHLGTSSRVTTCNDLQRDSYRTNLVRTSPLQRAHYVTAKTGFPLPNGPEAGLVKNREVQYALGYLCRPLAPRPILLRK